jgi:O-antigen/teichoic acid export membrane protein
MDEPATGTLDHAARASPRPVRLARLLARVDALRARTGLSGALVKSAVWSIGGYATGAAASFVTQVILARSLEATRYGVYSYLLAWVNVAVLVGKLEFDNLAIRFVGTYDGQRQDGLLRGFLRCGWRVVGATATAVALVAGLAAWLLRSHLHTVVGGGLWAACALVPLSGLLLFSSSALQGFRQVPQAQLPQLLLRPVLFGIALVVTVSGFGAELEAGGAVALNAAATAVALGVSLVLLDRAVPASTVHAEPAFDTPTWTRAIRGFLVISAAQLVLSQQADILVIGTLLGPRDAGLYSVASQLCSLIGLGATGVVFVVLPAVADLHARGRRAELQRLVVRTVQGCAVVSVPVAVLLFATGPFVLGAYGVAFAGAYPILIVLSVASVGGAIVGALSGYLLTMTGHEWEASRVIVGTALLNLVLTFILTPAFGAVGAALATAGAGLTRAELLRRRARRYLGVAVLPYFPVDRPAGSAP